MSVSTSAAVVSCSQVELRSIENLSDEEISDLFKELTDGWKQDGEDFVKAQSKESYNKLVKSTLELENVRIQLWGKNKDITFEGVIKEITSEEAADFKADKKIQLENDYDKEQPFDLNKENKNMLKKILKML